MPDVFAKTADLSHTLLLSMAEQNRYPQGVYYIRYTPPIGSLSELAASDPSFATVFLIAAMLSTCAANRCLQKPCVWVRM
jgi:hypothetical protein